MSAATNQYTSERHVYEAHRAGLPALIPYFRELWRRREFASELAKTQLRSANTVTFFGQAWLILNPLLLAFVYFLLVGVLTGRLLDPSKLEDTKIFFAQLTSGLFLYFYVTGIMSSSTPAMTQGGRLILNTPFPKLLLIFSTTYQAFRRYLPTLGVYVVIHIATGRPWSWHMLWMIPTLFFATLLGMGFGCMLSTLHVYFRDTASFLPYFIRIWLYMSPVLWTVEQLNARQDAAARLFMRISDFNPVFGILGIQGEVVGQGVPPTPFLVFHAAIWSIAIFILGSLFMMSREREFAVRL